MGLDEILRSLKGEAEEESSRLLTDARRKAAELLAAARAEEELGREALLASADAEIAREGHVTLGRTRARLNLEREAVRAEAVEQVFTEVRSRLSEARESPGYRTGLSALLREAMGAARGPVEVKVRPEDVASAAAANPHVPVTPDLRLDGGVIVCSVDGSVVLDNSLGTRLERASKLLRHEVTQLLFGDEPNGGS